MDHGACKPAEIARLIEVAGAQLPPGQMFSLPMLAGGLYRLWRGRFWPHKLLAGLAFSSGPILCDLIGGALAYRYAHLGGKV